MMTKPPPKLLVISEMGLGDALTLLPVLRSLQQHRPDLSIDMLAPGLFDLRKNVRDLLRLLDPSELMDSDKGGWLNDQAYTHIWNTENEHSEWRSILKESENPNWISAPPHCVWPHQFVLNVRLEQLRQLFPGIEGTDVVQLPLTSSQADLKRQLLSQKQRHERWIAIQPGAKDKTKCWPMQKYRQLIRRFSENPANKIKLFLTPEERRWYESSAKQDPPGLEILTESLDTLLPKLAVCDLFIGNDSGFYHLSYALNIPVVGIYRSRRNMKVWSYPSSRSKAVNIWLPSPIRKYWHHFVTVKMVYHAASTFLNPSTDRQHRPG